MFSEMENFHAERKLTNKNRNAARRKPPQEHTARQTANHREPRLEQSEPALRQLANHREPDRELREPELHQLTTHRAPTTEPREINQPINPIDPREEEPRHGLDSGFRQREPESKPPVVSQLTPRRLLVKSRVRGPLPKGDPRSGGLVLRPRVRSSAAPNEVDVDGGQRAILAKKVFFHLLFSFLLFCNINELLLLQICGIIPHEFQIKSAYTQANWRMYFSPSTSTKYTVEI